MFLWYSPADIRLHYPVLLATSLMSSQQVSIMEMDGFRRDTVKFFDKNHETYVTTCSRIDLRKHHKNQNIVNAYLNNSFGCPPHFLIWKHRKPIWQTTGSSCSLSTNNEHAPARIYPNRNMTHFIYCSYTAIHFSFLNFYVP